MLKRLVKKVPNLLKSIASTSYYRPQRSCGKVMFSQVFVILFTGGCVCVADTPPRQAHPRQTPPRADTPGQTPNRADTPLARHPLPSACWETHTSCPVHAGIHPLPPVATAADGTHPTGMHSCSLLNLLLRTCVACPEIIYSS